MKRFTFFILLIVSLTTSLQLLAKECQNYREFSHRDGIFSVAKLMGTDYDYQRYSRAYLALTNIELLQKVFGNEQQEAQVLAKAQQDFKNEVKAYSTDCFEVISSMDIGSYDYAHEQFKVTEVSEYYSMVFEALYTRNNRFARQYKLFIANHEDIKPIPYERSQVDNLLTALAQNKATFLHRLYFNVIGLKPGQRDSLLVKVHKVEVILEQEGQRIISTYHPK
ncbi:DUF4852 domain-containing protein [Thalassotalea ganghwensis]